MEKIIIPVCKNESIGGNQFRDFLLEKTSPALLSEGVNRLKVCVVDEDVKDAAPYRITSSTPVADAVLFVWVDTAIHRAGLERIIKQDVDDSSAFLVCESEPLANTTHTVAIGQRTPGMNQVVFLKKPEQLSFESWIDIWHNSHTQIAIDTQSTFGYRQNLNTPTRPA